MANSNMTYAQALTDAKSLIVQQSARIKTDAERMKSQVQELTSLRAASEEMSQEIDRLRGVEAQLADVTAGKEQAEASVGRQRVQIDSLESAAREMQRVLGEQADRIQELTREVEGLRDQLPSDADVSALAAMSSLLQSAKGAARGARPARAAQPELTQDAPAAADEAEPRGESNQFVIPAEPTPLRLVTERAAA
jgi:predicted  nucleic acid-binding Zn-ribbon protein